MLRSALTGHARKEAQKTANVFKIVAFMSIKLVHQYITLILIHKLQCEPGYFEPCVGEGSFCNGKSFFDPVTPHHCLSDTQEHLW